MAKMSFLVLFLEDILDSASAERFSSLSNIVAFDNKKFDSEGPPIHC